MEKLTHITREMPDSFLLASAKKHASSERKQSALVIAHLAEVYRRKLALKRGYRSLYEYTREELGYAEASAYRRTAAARLALRFPDTIEKIANGKLGICVAAETWRAIEQNEKNAKVTRLSTSQAASPQSSSFSKILFPAVTPPNLMSKKEQRTLVQMATQNNSQSDRHEFRARIREVSGKPANTVRSEVPLQQGASQVTSIIFRFFVRLIIEF